MSAEEPFAIPFRNDGICPSPLCTTPHLPVDFDLVRSVLKEIYFPFYSDIQLNACTYAVSVLQTEFCYTGVLERRILERYDSKEFDGSDLDQEEDDAELARLVEAVFEDGKGGVRASILAELESYEEKAILHIFGGIQAIVKANCDPATLRKQPLFCFHSIAGCVDAFKPALTKIREADAEVLVKRVPTYVDATRLDREIASAVSSGRWRGGRNVETILAAAHSFLLSANQVLELVNHRIVRLALSRILSPDEFKRATFPLVYEFNRCSNDKHSFLRSVNYHSFLRTHSPYSSATPSSPSSFATEQPIHPPPTLFTRIRYPRPFTQTSLLLPPTVCSPDRCSGQLPIAVNFGMVDSMLVELLGWRFMATAIRDFDFELLMMAAVEIAEHGGTLSVVSEERRKRFLADVPEALEEVSSSELFRRRSRDSMLARELRELQHLLFSMQRTHLPCICDLTHLTEELAAEIATAKANFELDNTLLSDIDISDDTPERLVGVFLSLASIRRMRPPAISEQGWRNEVGRYARFICGPIRRNIRSARFDISCLDTWRSIILQLGGTGVLEEIWAFALGDYRDAHDEVERLIPALQSLVDDAGSISPVEAVKMDQKAAIKAEKEKDLGACLHLLVKICILHPTNHSCILDPTFHSARLNSAGIRLRLANDTDQKFQWSRAIYDCTMSMYYGPPNFKAYYRRGLALAHLKKWKKAILDFGRALELEPGNVVAKQQLMLARTKKF